VVLDPQRRLELRRFRGLAESGAMSLSEVAKEIGLNWRTVSKYLSADGPVSPPRRSPGGRSRVRVIDEFAPLVDSMLRAEILMKAAVIHERLATEYGFTGNYQRTKLYVQEARPRIAEELGITPKELAGMHRRFEVIPGAQAQVDWGDEGKVLAHVGIAKVYSLLITMADGNRESAESWSDLLRDAARRGMRAPVLAVGDGALGFWKALAEVFPDTRHQRCWVHKTANVLNALPTSAQPGAKKALQEICNAEGHEHAVKAVAAFEKAYGAKWPKAARKITDDVGELLAFYDFPAEHWVHLRTPNPIESTFATVRPRTKVTKGAGSAAAGERSTHPGPEPASNADTSSNVPTKTLSPQPLDPFAGAKP
jgi:hypothetical protein